MLAQLKPIPSVAFTPPAFPGGSTFSCLMEGGVNIDAGHSIKGLNINFQFQLTAFSVILVEQQIEEINAAIVLLNEQLAFLNGQVTRLNESIALMVLGLTGYQNAYNKSPEGSQAREEIVGAKEALKAQLVATQGEVFATEGQEKGIKQQIITLENQKKDLALREGRELLNLFRPLTVTARLVKGVEKEVVWIGTLDYTLVPVGSQKTSVRGLPDPGPGPGYRVVEYPNALLAYEGHISLEPFTLHKAEPLELIITVTGPPSFPIITTGVGLTGVAGTGILPENGKIGIKSGTSSVVGTGKVECIASENSVNYEHEP